MRTAAFGKAKKMYFSPDAVDVAVNICFQVWHSPAPVDQEQTNTEMVARVKDNFEDREKPEDDFEDGPGEVAPEADVAEAKGLHDLMQVLHVLPVWIHHYSVSVSCRTTKTNLFIFSKGNKDKDKDKPTHIFKKATKTNTKTKTNLLIFSTSSRCSESSTSNS